MRIFLTRLIARLCLAALTLLSAHLPALAGEITFYVNDLTGSPIAAMSEKGQVTWRENFKPYGERIGNDANAAEENIWFTARHQDADTGLIYMGARYYDPKLGRFLSTDPVRFSENNLQSFNRYAYANNNPFKYIDPDGRKIKFANGSSALFIETTNLYLDTLRQTATGSALYSQLEDSKHVFILQEAKISSARPHTQIGAQTKGLGSGGVIEFNSNEYPSVQTSKGPELALPEFVLAHELAHASEFERGKLDFHSINPKTGTYRFEESAIAVENKIRAEYNKTHREDFGRRLKH